MILMIQNKDQKLIDYEPKSNFVWLKRFDTDKMLGN